MEKSVTGLSRSYTELELVPFYEMQWESEVALRHLDVREGTEGSPKAQKFTQVGQLSISMQEKSKRTSDFAASSMQSHPVRLHEQAFFLDHGINTPKQLEQKKDLHKEFNVSVAIRVKAVKAKLNNIADSGAWHKSPKKIKSIKKEIEKLCDLYGIVLKGPTNNQVFNFSTFLQQIHSDGNQINEQDKKEFENLMLSLQDIRNVNTQLESEVEKTLADVEKEIAEEIDNSLKYVDVEQIRSNELNKTTFSKSKESEGNLNDFMKNTFNSLTLNQISELTESFDKISETMKSLKILNGDLKQDNIIVYKTVDEDGTNHYHMKIKNLEKLKIDEKMGVENKTHTRDNESLLLMKIMLLTSKYKYSNYRTTDYTLNGYPLHQEIGMHKENALTSNDERVNNLLQTPLGVLFHFYGTKYQNVYQNRDNFENYFSHPKKEGRFSFSCLSPSIDKRSNTEHVIRDFLRHNFDRKYNSGKTPTAQDAIKMDLKIFEAYEAYSHEDMSSYTDELKKMLGIRIEDRNDNVQPQPKLLKQRAMLLSQESLSTILRQDSVVTLESTPWED